MDMAPETSEGEQGKEEAEIVPAPPVPDPKQQQARDVKAHQDSEEEAAEARVELLIRKLRKLRARISQLLGPAGPHRVVSGDTGRRCLAFMNTELSIIAAVLTTLSPQQRGLMEHSLLDVPRLADRVLREVDPSRHTLLRRARQCFHHRRKSYLLVNHMVWLYYISEHPCRYMHLPVTSSDLGLTPPHLAEAKEAGALPLVGIDRPAKKILRWLSHQGKTDRSLRVVCIVGPVGIGKTTLAVELRNRLKHETSGRCSFQCNVMVQASRGTDRNILLLQDILSQVSKSALSYDPSQAKTLEVLVRLVSECLRDKRYFIIIDDIREASDWDDIKRAFPDTSSLGSRILITTHSTSIAIEWACRRSYSDDYLVHKMKPLNDIDSERLLLAKVVGSEDGCLLPDNMKLFYNGILRCDGIPLFITGMVDWLKEQQLLQRQRQGEDDDKYKDEERQRFAIYWKEQVPRLPGRLEQSLSSAFNDFPSSELRLQSLYMSMFPYGYKFEKDRLILKWIHEDLIDCAVFYDLENNQLYVPKYVGIAERFFFSQLVDRNVITCVASNCKHYEDEAEACQWQVNHFMHQFLASKSAEMGLIFTTTTLSLVAGSAADRGNENKTSSRMPRRLALHHPDPLLPSLLETMDLSQTRSLAVSGAVSGISLDKFVNLVVLDLEGWENLKDEDLVQVCRSKMIFLTYLSVRNTRVRKLPHEIKMLRILETLDISYTQITELPLEVFELRYLEHLDTRGTQISQLPKQIEGLRDGLTHLLFGGGEGTMNSIETAARAPHYEVWRLYRLKTLATVDLTRQPASFIRALGDLDRLMVLAITWSFHQSTDRDYCEALLSSIEKWEKLEFLTIHCGLGCSMDFLASLEKFRAPRGLNKLKVTAGRFTSVPPWIDGLWFLSFVQITICRQATDDLKILGDLRNLQCLILGLDFIPGQAIVIGNEGFRLLQRFSVDCVLPWLTFQTGAMPWLSHLRLNFSSGPAIEECVPSGISNLRMISEVVLSYSKWCANSTNVKMTVKAVREQVAKHHNPIDLFINDVEDDGVQVVDEEAENATGTSSSRTEVGPGRDDAQAVDEKATGVTQTEITEAES